MDKRRSIGLGLAGIGGILSSISIFIDNSLWLLVIGVVMVAVGIIMFITGKEDK
jgi:hypothetical protein